VSIEVITFNRIKKEKKKNITLVGLEPIVSCSVVISAELGREDHGSIPATAIGRDWNHLMHPEPDSSGGEKKKTLVGLVFTNDERAAQYTKTTAPKNFSVQIFIHQWQRLRWFSAFPIQHFPHFLFAV
jgi:hypothetical protein